HVRSKANDLVWVPESESTAVVTVVDRTTSRTVYNARLTGVLARHYHPAEFRNGLYAIGRIGIFRWGSRDWTDELWRFQGSKRRTLLFAGQSFNYQIAPNDSFIVILADSDFECCKQLVMLSSNGKPIRTIMASELQLEHLGGFWATDRF